MSNASTSFFRITLKAITAALIALVLVGAARADTIKKFAVSGTERNVFSGGPGSCASFEISPFSGKDGGRDEQRGVPARHDNGH